MSPPVEQGRSPSLVRSLLDPAAYPHPVETVALVETHISWVFLTGDFAYKVKKPVRLGFLDFSTLERRRRFCEEELRVNRRTAPSLYLEVVPVGNSAGGLVVGREPAVDYAVRMRQFPYDARLDRCLGDGRLQRADMRTLAETIARFHASLPPRRDIDPEAETERVIRPARNNFVHLEAGDFDDECQQRLAVIESWTLEQSHTLSEAFAGRALDGFVRECHGDLHLENLLFLENRFLPFDAIEFSENLRWIDTASDVAFLVMDLAARRQTGFAHTVLCGWLEANGDYESLALMRFYLVYRSLVRAVVSRIRSGQATAPTDTSVAGSLRPGAQRYVALAAELVDTPPPSLYLMHGFSGSGKTWLSERLVEALPALRVRSDLERKRLAEDTGAEAERYGAGATERTYERVWAACRIGLRAGFDMIADATFLDGAQRRHFRRLAERTGARCVIVDCQAPPELLRSRVRRRAAERSDASDATVAVLERQLSAHDPLTPAEAALARVVRSDEDMAAIVARLAGGG